MMLRVSLMEGLAVCAEESVPPVTLTDRDSVAVSVGEDERD